MMVVMIVGILAGIAIPGYQKTIEKGYGDKAKVVLQALYRAEKLYRLDYNTYGDLNELIRGNYIDNPNTSGRKFNYSVNPPPPTTFEARARRGSNYLAINQDGPVSGLWTWP